MELIIALLVTAIIFAPEYCGREHPREYVSKVIGVGLLLTAIVISAIFLFKANSLPVIP